MMKRLDTSPASVQEGIPMGRHLGNLGEFDLGSRCCQGVGALGERAGIQARVVNVFHGRSRPARHHATKAHADVGLRSPA